MKTKFKHALLLTFFALLTFTSCQNEFTDISEPDAEQVIVADSPLATLMKSTSTNSGSTNDVVMGDIDFTNSDVNCLSINLPVTINVNGITIIIDTHEDLELIQDIYEEFNDDDDVLEFIFPITIILNDYTQVDIENIDELQQFIDRCNGVEEAIKCVDFIYPISFSIFNTQFQIIDTIVIENDRALYHFLQRLENAEVALLASLNFPVKMIFANGETVEVHNNQELERVINEAEGMCDDERDRCDIDEVDDYLIECHWNIHYYNDDDNFRPYDVFFLENGELNIVHQNATVAITGNWNTAVTDDGVVLTISNLTQFDEHLNGDWLIVECDDDRFKLVRQNAAAGTDNTRIVLKRRCADEPDCSPQQIREALQDCNWHTGSNAIDNSDGLGVFHFGDDGAVYVDLPNGNEITGTWEIALTDYGIKLILELPEPYNELTRYWKVIECDNDRIKVTNENHYIVFERDCEDDPLACYEDTYLLQCRSFDDMGNYNAKFDLTKAFETCNIESGTVISYYNTYNNGALIIPISNPEEYYFNIFNDQVTWVNARVELSSGDFKIVRINLRGEDCGNDICPEEDVNSALSECRWNPIHLDYTSLYKDHDFYFNEGQELIVEGINSNYVGTWETTTDSASGRVILRIQIAVGLSSAFTGDWFVTECTDEHMIVKKFSDNVFNEMPGYESNRIVFKRECQ